MKKRTPIFLAIAILLLIAFIFYNSAQDGEESSNASNFVTEIINGVLNFFGITADWKSLSHLIRKGAHFSEYFALGLLTSAFIACLSRKRIYISLSPLLAFAVAVCDEFLVQGATTGRSPQWSDVLIDLSGAITAATFVVLALLLIARRKHKKENSK